MNKIGSFLFHKKLDEEVTEKENHSHPEHTTEPKFEANTKTVKTKQLIRLIAAHLHDSERKAGQVSETVRETERHVLSEIEEFKKNSCKPETQIIN